MYTREELTALAEASPETIEAVLWGGYMHDPTVRLPPLRSPDREGAGGRREWEEEGGGGLRWAAVRSPSWFSASYAWR